MAFFLQKPPIGIYPNAVIERTDECWVYRWDTGWGSVTDPKWYRYWGGRGTEFIPDVVIEAWHDNPPIKDVAIRIIEERPASGAFGLLSRDRVMHLTSSDSPVLHSVMLGFIWHPDPEAFAHCRAQEKSRELVALQQKAFRDSGDLSWTRFETFDNLWEAIQ
jgi:hypothetical protein